MKELYKCSMEELIVLFRDKAFHDECKALAEYYDPNCDTEDPEYLAETLLSGDLLVDYYEDNGKIMRG